MTARILASIFGTILLVGILVGGYLGGWWLRADRVDRTAQIDETTFARQTALQQEVLDLNRDIRNIDVQMTDASDEQRAPLQAQRRAMVDRFCDAHARMTDTVQIPQSAAQLASQECF